MSSQIRDEYARFVNAKMDLLLDQRDGWERELDDLEAEFTGERTNRWQGADT